MNYLSDVLKNVGADAFVLQEIGSKEVLEQVVRETGIPYRVFLAQGDHRGIGNAILYRDVSARVEPLLFENLVLPVFEEGDQDVNGPRIHKKRANSYYTSSFHGKTLHLIGVHMKSTLPLGIKRDGVEQKFQTQLEATDSIIRSAMFRLAEARALPVDVPTVDSDHAPIVFELK